jgi:hypothetical protein
MGAIMSVLERRLSAADQAILQVMEVREVSLKPQLDDDALLFTNCRLLHLYRRLQRDVARWVEHVFKGSEDNLLVEGESYLISLYTYRLVPLATALQPGLDGFLQN